MEESTNRNLQIGLTPELYIAPVDKAMILVESSIPIFAMSENQFEREIKVSIGKAIVMYGINNTPSKEEMNIIKKLLLSTFKYSRLNILQIDQAFEFNIAGELEEEFKPFNMFSTSFLCSVLNAYIKRHEISLKERPKQKTIYNTPTEEELRRNEFEFKRTIILYFNKFCENENCVLVNPTDVFVYLERCKLINESKEDKLKIIEQARRARLEELKNENTQVSFSKKVNNLILRLQQGEKPEEEDGMIKTIAREITLRKWFKKWKDEGFDLTGALIN